MLTLEHIPPRSTGNRGSGTLEYLSLSSESRTIRTSTRDGIAVRVLCQRCNTSYGSTLGTGFGEFAKQVQRSGRLESPHGGVFVSSVAIYPGRIMRQLLLTFLCAQPRDAGSSWDDIRNFIRSRTETLPATAPRVSVYYNPSESYRIVPVCSVGAITFGRRWAGSEIAAPGLGVIFSVANSSMDDIQWIIEKRPLDISSWGDVRFDDRVTLALELPRLRVEHPHPLGFGRPIDVERWQTRKRIVWAVGTADDPNSPTAVAALWQPHRRGRRRGT
jgi:hypothetical protein